MEAFLATPSVLPLQTQFIYFQPMQFISLHVHRTETEANQQP